MCCMIRPCEFVGWRKSWEKLGADLYSFLWKEAIDGRVEQLLLFLMFELRDGGQSRLYWYDM